MDNRKLELAAGSLLHDTGKILYRYNDQRNHCDSGYDFLKEIINSTEILDCVRYHHAGRLKNANVKDDALCYITYIADNISAFSDRRKSENGDSGFVRDISYGSIFNILNGNDGKSVYTPSMLTENNEVIYPSEKDVSYTESFYARVADTLKNAVKGTEETSDYISSLNEISEACLSYIPSSTQTGELRDISLYDHVKLTAALALCIYDYALDNNIKSFKEAFFSGAEKFYSEEAFILYSADMSGIQNFIYNISSKAALKGLRSRSFYLEIVMEHFVDTVTERLELCRCNVLYTGGGHTYMLLPNTQKVLDTLSECENEINSWFADTFGADLFLAGGYSKCSADSLRNMPEGSYRKIFSDVSKRISHRKLNRYSADELIRMNSKSHGDYERECTICNRSDSLEKWKDGTFICRICSRLLKLSDSVADRSEQIYYTVISSEKSSRTAGAMLPFGCTLVSDTKESLTDAMNNEEGYVRSYSKNTLFSGKRVASKLWVGDYSAEKDFSALVEKSEGIDRLCVLRADVDNLGTAFVSGFPEKYTTISRTSAFSSKLSLFFKHDINRILEEPQFAVTGNIKEKRNVSIIYSGGDDVFVVGGWDDVIGFAVDLSDALKKFSLGTLTVSAGIGMFDKSYPLYSMAGQTGKLEDFSKKNPGKDSVTLFDETGRYHWKEFKEKVVGEKLAAIREFLDGNEERGKAMLYRMLELIRENDAEVGEKEGTHRLNIARFAYVLARLAPADKTAADYDDRYCAYNEFKGKMYNWVNADEDRRQLVTAIYLYIYSVRKKENDNG